MFQRSWHLEGLYQVHVVVISQLYPPRGETMTIVSTIYENVDNCCMKECGCAHCRVIWIRLVKMLWYEGSWSRRRYVKYCHVLLRKNVEQIS